MWTPAAKAFGCCRVAQHTVAGIEYRAAAPLRADEPHEEQEGTPVSFQNSVAASPETAAAQSRRLTKQSKLSRLSHTLDVRATQGGPFGRSGRAPAECGESGPARCVDEWRHSPVQIHASHPISPTPVD